LVAARTQLNVEALPPGFRTDASALGAVARFLHFHDRFHLHI
jgi:hypothetical protein